MRLVYSSDLHGNASTYASLLDLAVERRADAVIVAGDLLPRSNSLSRAIAVQHTFVERELRSLLQQFRRESAAGVYLLAGNDDWAAAIAALDELEHEGLVHPLHTRVYPLSHAVPPGTAAGAGMFLAGYACVPITPFSIKDYERRDNGPMPGYNFEMAYMSGATPKAEPRRITPVTLMQQPSIAEDLDALAQRSPPTRTVYVCHAPPYNTALDLARGKHTGSVAMRQFIERYKPPLTLHGHIHEAPTNSGRYAERLGSTWCLNPGHDGRRFHAITLDTEDVAGTLWHTVYGGLRA